MCCTTIDENKVELMEERKDKQDEEEKEEKKEDEVEGEDNVLQCEGNLSRTEAEGRERRK